MSARARLSVWGLALRIETWGDCDPEWTSGRRRSPRGGGQLGRGPPQLTARRTREKPPEARKALTARLHGHPFPVMLSGSHSARGKGPWAFRSRRQMLRSHEGYGMPRRGLRPSIREPNGWSSTAVSVGKASLIVHWNHPSRIAPSRRAFPPSGGRPRAPVREPPRGEPGGEGLGRPGRPGTRTGPGPGTAREGGP